MLCPLQSVTLVLRRQTNADVLQNLGEIICSFLGPSRNLSLHEACKFGSLTLLDWIWRSSSSSESERISTTWSLTNYLRSEPLYYNWEFVEAMKVAASRGDLEILKWLMTHFSGCEVNTEVVEVAARRGQLNGLVFLWDNIQNGDNAGHVVNWNGRIAHGAVLEGHYDLVQWLHEHKLHGPNDGEIVEVVCRALRIGGQELAEFLVPSKRHHVNYDSSCIRAEMAELIITCSREVNCATRAFEALARRGDLNMMQSILLLHSPLLEDQTKWISSWGEALQYSCMLGDLPVLHWLMEHPLGDTAVNSGDNVSFFGLMHAATEGGHTDTVEFLISVGAMAECGGVGVWVNMMMQTAIRRGHLDTFKWMIDRGWCANSARLYLLVNKAAEHGHVGILEYLHGLKSMEVFYPTRNGFKRTISTSILWSKGMAVNIASTHGHLAVIQWLHVNVPRTWSTNVMNVASAHGHLDIVKWLHTNRDEGCTTEAMDRAAANGHLEVLQWLYANRTEGCSSAAMDDAASSGHIEIVQWLHENTSAECTPKAMDLAAKNGHLQILKWLDANRSADCTVNAITNALCNGHLRVSYWLQSHYPQHTPSELTLSFEGVKRFEVLLFMRVHYSDLFTPSFKENILPLLVVDEAVKSNCTRIVAWLEEKCR